MLKIKKAITNFCENEFNRNFLKLLSGGALSAVITIFAIPITTRLYSPEQFGMFQLFSSIIIVLSSISSFKYEMAIVLPRTLIRSKALVQLSLIVLLATTLVYCFIFAFFGEALLIWLSAESLIPYMILFPFSIFIAGLFQVVQYMVINKKEYADLSKNKVVQTSLNQSGAISFRLTGGTTVGLLISFTAAQLLATFLLLRKHNVKINVRGKKHFRLLAIRYKKFPLINMVSVFLNTLSMQLPVFMLGKFASAEAVGIYMLANRLLEMPLSLLNGPATQVYIKTAADKYHEGVSELKKLYLSLLKKLSFIGLLAVVAVFVFSDIAVTVFLGDEWAEVAFFMCVLIVGKFFQFINAPLSSTLMIINRQELGMLMIIVSLAFRYWSMYFVSFDVLYMMYALTVSSSLFYGIYNITMYKAIQ